MGRAGAAVLYTVTPNHASHHAWSPQPLPQSAHGDSEASEPPCGASGKQPFGIDTSGSDSHRSIGWPDALPAVVVTEHHAGGGRLCPNDARPPGCSAAASSPVQEAGE
jgi:hypothetical protein